MMTGKHKNWSHGRRVNTRVFAETVIIFCEGEKTEKNYFEGLKQTILSGSAVYKNTIEIRVFGKGTNTLGVLAEAQNYVRRQKIENADVWCVYDKDDFPPERFDQVESQIEVLNKGQDKVRYRAAWSNECFEVWLLLHYENRTVNGTRKSVEESLDKYFRKHGYPCYSKTDPEIFERVTKTGNTAGAIRYAEKILKNHRKEKSSNIQPGTTVHLLVKQLSQYLPDEIKKKFQ